MPTYELTYTVKVLVEGTAMAREIEDIQFPLGAKLSEVMDLRKNVVSIDSRLVRAVEAS